MRVLSAALMGASLVLVGCGPEAEPETTPDWAIFDAQVEAEAVAVTSGGGAGDIGGLLNAARAGNGLAPLSASAKLAAAARVHAQDMARNGNFSHTGSDGSKPSARVRAQGYGYCFVAENIAQGYPTAERTMAGWMNSPGHRRNNLSTKATEYGAAKAGEYWVLVFGTPGC